MTSFVVTAVQAVEHTLTTAEVESVLDQRARRATGRCRLAEELRDHSVRLTTDDPRTSPILAQVVADLRTAGYEQFTQPTCPLCGRSRIYAYPSTAGTRICGTCRPRPTEPCAECGRDRSVVRRLPDGTGLCATCRTHDVAKFERCTSCGRNRWVATRDELGRPHCGACYKGRTPDPTGRWVGDAAARRTARTATLLAVLRPVAGHIPDGDLTQCLDRVAPTPNGHAMLANWLLDHPDSLHDGDNNAPPVAIKLIDELLTLGATPTRPGCANCGRTDRRLPHRTGNGRVCPSCYLTLNAEPCSACGATAPVQRRLDGGKPLCARCATPYRTRVTCASCGRQRQAAGTIDGIRLCSTCKRRDNRSHERCRLCGRHRPVGGRAQDGGAICPNCSLRARTADCVRCGRSRPVAARVDGHPYCASCRPRRPKECSRCGQRAVCYRVITPDDQREFGDEVSTAVCGCCLASERLNTLLAGPSGSVEAHWMPLVDLLLEVPNPAALLEWIRDRSTAKLLGTLAHQDSPPTHADLDQLATTSRHAAEQARAFLEAAGLLDRLDTRRNRLSTRATRRIEREAPPEDRLMLKAYLRWSVLPALERRARRRKTSIAQRNISDVAVVIAYLNDVRSYGLSLTDRHQARLELWVSRHASHRFALKRFLTWAQRNGYSSPVRVPAAARRPPKEFIPDTQRDHMIGVAIRGTDPSWTIPDRVAVLLVLLYGQPPLRIVVLTRDHLTRLPSGGLQLRLGHDPVDLLPPVAVLVSQLATRQVPSQPLRDLPSSWLYPGHSAGRHLHHASLARRLKVLGVPARAARNTSLLDLVKSAPSSVLADLLGLHVGTVEAWSNTSGARWAQYVNRASIT